MQKYGQTWRTTVIAGIGAFVLAIFLPPRVTIIGRELTTYALESVFHQWIIALTVSAFLVLCFYLGGRRSNPTHKKTAKQIRRNAVTISLATVTVTFLVSAFTEIAHHRYNVPAIAFAGCYTVNSDGVLVEDSEAEYLGEMFYGELQKAAATHSTFSTEVLKLGRVHLPGFLPPILGRNSLDKWLRQYLGFGQYITLLYCYRKPDGHQIELRHDYFSGAFGPVAMESNARMEDEIGFITLDLALNTKTIVEAISGFHIAVAGQAIVDYLIEEKDFGRAHLVVDNSQKILREVGSRIRREGSAETIVKYDQLERHWDAELELVRSRLFVEQMDYAGAIRHLLLALDDDPYYPCEGYEDYKANWLRVYGNEVSDMYDSLEKGAKATEKDIKHVGAGWPYLPTGERIQDILIEHADNSEVCTAVGMGLRHLLERRKDNPLLWMIWGNVVKFLPKGEKRKDKVYVDRIPEAGDAFENARGLDPLFPLIPFKLGALELLEGDSGMEQGVSEDRKKRALNWIRQGSDVYVRYMKAAAKDARMGNVEDTAPEKSEGANSTKGEKK